MSSDSNRPEHQAPDEEAREEQQHGQVSEAGAGGLGGEPEPVGGADETDKSTGTAPDEADEPGA